VIEPACSSLRMMSRTVFAVQRVQISQAFCVPAVARRIVIEQRCGPRSRCTAMRAGLRTLQPVRLKPKFSLVAPQGNRVKKSVTKG
jgi:hypothetical protein